MGRSATGDREERTRSLFRNFWLPLREDYNRGRITEAESEYYQEGVVETLVDECEPEILEAFRENPSGCVLCGFEFAEEDGRWVLTEYPEIIASTGVLRALNTVTKLGTSKSLHNHVKDCVAEVLKEYEDERREKTRKALRKRAPAELLPYMTRQPRPSAAVLLALLTHDQRCGLLALALREAGANRFEIPFGPQHEPQEPLLWVIWYTAWLCAATVYLQYHEKNWGEPDGAVFDNTGRGARPNKKKQPRNLYGPLIDKVLRDLAREANDPEKASERKIAKLLMESHTTLRRYRMHEEYPKLPTAHRNGDKLEIALTGEDIWRLLSITSGERRGRKSRTS